MGSRQGCDLEAPHLNTHTHPNGRLKISLDPFFLSQDFPRNPFFDHNSFPTSLWSVFASVLIWQVPSSNLDYNYFQRGRERERTRILTKCGTFEGLGIVCVCVNEPIVYKIVQIEDKVYGSFGCSSQTTGCFQLISIDRLEEELFFGDRTSTSFAHTKSGNDQTHWKKLISQSN